jgi:hypothetical protein
MSKKSLIHICFERKILILAVDSILFTVALQI